MNRLAVAPLTLAAAVCLLPSALAAQQDDAFRWRGQLAAGKTIEIKGVNGDVRAEPASGREIEVTAAKRARRSDPSEVEIRVVEHGDGVTICAVYPTPRGERENECAPGSGGRMNTRNNDVNVDFVVKVPAGVDFAGSTVNGEIEALDLAGDAYVSTVNGGIEVSARGLVEATTVNGSIDAVMGRADWTGPLNFTTVNGSIDLTLPADAAFEVTGSTVNGDIESDFPITVKGKWGPRRVSGTVNGGGRSLDLETVNGGLRIRRAG